MFCIKAKKRQFDDDQYGVPAKNSPTRVEEEYSVTEVHSPQMSQPRAKKLILGSDKTFDFYAYLDLSEANQLIKRLSPMLQHKHNGERCKKLVFLNQQYGILVKKIQWNISEFKLKPDFGVPHGDDDREAPAVNIRSLTRRLQHISRKVEAAIRECKMETSQESAKFKSVKMCLYPDLSSLNSQFCDLRVTASTIVNQNTPPVTKGKLYPNLLL